MAKQFLLVLTLTGTLVLPRAAIAQKPSDPKPNPAKPAINTHTQTAPGGTIADTAIKFADSLFHQPSFLYQQVESGIPPDIQPILTRFNNALIANRQWFEEYKNSYAGQPLPYNARFGINADDYKRLQNFTPQPVPIDTQKVNVIHEAGYIRFHGIDSSFQLLDYMMIDTRKLLLVYGGDTIPLVGRTITTPSSPYGEWQGFTWRLEKADAAATLTTRRVTARVIEINMGLTAPSADQTAAPAKVFLRVKYQQMQEGVTTANLEMVGFVH